MNSNIKIAVIGGTGKAGKYLVKQLLKQGFNMRLLLRNPEKFTTESTAIEILQGDAGNEADVYSLIQGCHAVISMLGTGVPPSEYTIFRDFAKEQKTEIEEFSGKVYIIEDSLKAPVWKV